MVQFLIQEKKSYLIFFFWVFIGVFTGPLAYFIITAHLIFLFKKNEWLLILLGLWLMLTLSDSRQNVFLFAQTLKILMMGLLGVLFLLASKKKSDFYFFSPFIFFFSVAVIAWLNSPIIFYSFMKMSSYALLLLVIPWLINKVLILNRDYFLFHFVLLGTLVLFLGLILKIVSPGFVIWIGGGRFSGLLGNPNGLGIYAFMFFALVTVIFTYHSYLFTRKEKLGVYAIILISLVLSGSRGGMFSTMLFMLGWFLFRKSKTIGFVVMISLLISYQLILANLDQIAAAFGLEAFLRIETLSSGSGRLVAQEFAWDQIKTQYWLGRGFGYAEYLMKLNAEDFISTEHQGNVHNSYLTIWLDTGLIGLIAFCYGWLINFIRAARMSPIIWALLFGLILSTSVESWLSASLNPFTIQLVIILSLVGNYTFYRENDLVESPSQFHPQAV